MLGRLELNITAKKAAVSGLTLLLLNKEYELLERLMLADSQCCVAGDLLVSLWQEAGLAEPMIWMFIFNPCRTSFSLLMQRFVCNRQAEMVGAHSSGGAI